MVSFAPFQVKVQLPVLLIGRPDESFHRERVRQVLPFFSSSCQAKPSYSILRELEEEESFFIYLSDSSGLESSRGELELGEQLLLPLVGLLGGLLQLLHVVPNSLQFLVDALQLAPASSALFTAF